MTDPSYRILRRTAEMITGRTDIEDRPGQVALSNQIAGCLSGMSGPIVAEAPTGLGKALDLTTPIPTPDGWTTMGDLRVGDEVFDENGLICRVTDAFAVRHNRPCYRLTFSDGTSIVADADHQWATTTSRLRAQVSERRKYKNPSPVDPFLVMTTEEMYATQYVDGGKRKNHAIVVAGALTLPDANLPIDPYVFGVWLGDGHSDSGKFTSTDPQIADEIEARGYYVVRPEAGTNYPHIYRINIGPETVNNRWHDSFTKRLGEMGVQRNKHIPIGYLRASAGQRLELLRGLMDTDGTVSSQSGRCEIVLCSEALALGVLELVRSLGMKPSYASGPAAITETDPETGEKTRRVVGTRYRVGFVTDVEVVTLDRKKALLPETVRPTQRYRYVESIEPVETRPVRCITVDSPNHLFLAGEAMIPTHNSASYLAPAAYAASLGERTVISTESLALQTQIVEKDAPMIAKACKEVTGYHPKVAVLKGFSNYACARASVEQAEKILGDHDVAANRQKALKDPYGHVRSLVSRLAGKSDSPAHPETSLVRWALTESVNDRTGDKFAFDGKMDHETWGTVSVSSSECVGVEKCPFADMCLPRKSRTVAAEADIIVTNHTMLGVQASKGVPVVIGSKTLGEFHNVVVDEAHGLPGVVRNQGASYVSGLRFYQTANALKNVFDPHDPATTAYIEEAGVVGDMVDAALSEWSQNLSEGEVVRLGDGDNPLKSVLPRAKRWIKAVKENLETVADNPSANEIAIRRLIARVDDLAASMKNCDDHEPGTARWIEVEDRGPRPWTVVRYTPVDVSGALNFNVWTAPDLEAEEQADAGPTTPDIHFDDDDAESDESGEKVNPYATRRQLNVACVSATLPVSFCRDVGLRTQIQKFESPFAKAFSQSVLFVPRADNPADIAALAGETANQSRPKFNTRMHQVWAANIMARLVEANRGSALVLSATAGSGRKYAEHLRANSGGRYKVISQWDGLTIRQATDEWKRDPSAVLVGTRSLMTGVDAPGETNSLVIIDRIPRAASNPVDDARVEKLMNDADFDRWAADRMVYGGDAALLLEQAGGRLIRSVNDSGMVAVLDPRLLKVGKMLYPAPTRDLYLGALAHFTNKMSNLDKACAWLERRSARVNGADA